MDGEGKRRRPHHQGKEQSGPDRGVPRPDPDGSQHPGSAGSARPLDAGSHGRTGQADLAQEWTRVQGDLHDAECAEPGHGQAGHAYRRSLRTCPFVTCRAGRPPDARGSRQRRCLQADDRKLHMAVKSLYVEPAEGSGVLRWGALECHDVFKIYRSGPVETVALRGLDLRVEPGELVAVLGPSGCGKSTLLALAAGLEEPSAGELRVWGRSLGRLDEAELATYRARDLAIVFQSENLWPALSAQENVAVSLRLAGHADAEAAAAHSLGAFGLAERRSHRAAALSGGEQQRVAIAAAAARRARLVLADEPAGELDQLNEGAVLEALRRLRDEFGSTVVVVTHSTRVAAAADRVLELRDGRLA